VKTCRSWVFSMVLWVVLGSGVALASAEEVAGEVSERQLSACDQFMEEYVRSSARKMFRALNREYTLRTLELPAQATLSNGTETLTFEVFTESDARVAGLIDVRREWTKTYLVADTRIGPVIVSQRWQPRRSREAGQACEPVLSAVEWPLTAANTVEIEPFRFWGLRVSWRIPPPDRAVRDGESVLTRLGEILEAQASSVP
jgi:hypothetical protein